MKSLAKNTAIVLTAALVFVTSQAHAVAGQDNSVSGNPVSPTYRSRFCLGDSCTSYPQVYVANQSLDCNQGNIATPSPIDESLSDLLRRVRDSVDWFPGSDWLGNQDASLPPLRSDAHLRSYPRFRNYLLESPPGDPVDSADPELGVHDEVRDPSFGAGFGYYDKKPKKYRSWGRFYDRIKLGLPRSDAGRQGLKNYEPGRQQYMFFPHGGDLGIRSLPGLNLEYSDFGAGGDPIKGTVGVESTTFEDRVREASESVTPGQDSTSVDFGMPVDGLAPQTYEERVKEAIKAITPAPGIGSLNFQTPADGISAPLSFFVNQQLDIGGTQWTSLMFDEYNRGLVINLLEFASITVFEINGCRVVLVPTDPNFIKTGRGSWGQAEDDQWAIKRVGYTGDENSAWNQVPETASAVVVAVIDTGLDWHHLDISHENIWRNEREIPDNGIDDDRNGYVDDLIGWNFLARNNKPWDFDGHGTVVTGIIAATQNNDAGIAGINPHARIMVLKAVNNFGTTRASYLAEAIVYAADNGARVINISVGGPHTSLMEQAAIDYANEKGALVVAASGNDGVELDDFGPGGADNVLTVGATHTDDRAAEFSNYGDKVDLVAPGVDVLSLRARYTDANYRPGSEEYVVGTNYVGEDKRYIHVSGTSFSAPIVAATASLLMAKNPALTAAEVRDLLQQTAEDIESPGRDKYSGYGMVNAKAALGVGPGFYVTAEITGVEPVETEAGTVLHIKGTIDADGFKRAWMQIGAGENPGSWKYVGQKRKYAIHDGVLGTVPLTEFSGSDLWQVVINVEHRNGIRKSYRHPVRIN